jgi:hypothetical protein
MRMFVVFILLLVPSLAMAQSKPKGPLKAAASLGGTIARPAAAPVATPDALWQKIQAVNAADLRYAKALADAVGSPGAKLRSACYAALILTIEQAQGPGLKDASGNALVQPEPHAFASFEQVAEVAEALQPTGPLMAACAPAWTALRLSAVQFFTMAVSGAAGLSALAIAIP